MEELLSRFGLAAVYVGAAIEGDVVLILTGVAAHLGIFNLPLALLSAAAGSLTGDLVWYWAGRGHSDAIQRMRVYRAVGPLVDRLATRIGPWQILAARLFYGTRIATMLFWGLRRLPPSRFILMDLMGCGIWALVLGSVGYAASTAATLLLGEVQRAELWLLGALCAAVIIILIMGGLGPRSYKQTSGGPS